MNTQSAYLFFSAPRGSNRAVVRGIQVLTLSQITHVAIGSSEVVFEHGFETTRFWPFIAYFMGYPDLRWIVRIRTPRPIDLAALEGTGPKRAWRVALWWASRGLIGSRTGCVAIATDTLRRAGIRVPRRIVTPKALLRWCRAKGYEAASC